MITDIKINLDLASLSDQKILYDFAKEMHFDAKGPGNKSTRDRTLKQILESPAFTASGFSLIFLSENPNKLCDRLKLLLQEKQAGKNSEKIHEEIVVIVDKLFEYKCISTKQHKQLSYKCNLLHTKKK